MFQSIKALVIKDIKITFRNPILLLFSVIMPVVFIFLYSIITQVSATNPIVIGRDSYGAASNEFIEIIKNMKSIDGPYFTVNVLDGQEAMSLYEKGKVAAIIEIPADFDKNIKENEPSNANLYVNNLNSDGTKNFQLRLSHAIYIFQKQYDTNSVINIEETYSRFTEDVSMKLYISIGLLMFAVIYSSMINTGILMAREWEERTAKEIVMTPKGFSPLVIGKWISTLFLTTISSMLVIIVLHFTLNFPIKEMKINVFGWLLVLFFFGASIGSLIGIGIKRTLPIVTISGITGIALYLVCGNESSIRGFAHGGAIEVLWNISKYIPICQITENIRYTFIQYGAYPDYESLIVAIILIFIFTAISTFGLKSSLYNTSGQ